MRKSSNTVFHLLAIIVCIHSWNIPHFCLAAKFNTFLYPLLAPSLQCPSSIVSIKAVEKEKSTLPSITCYEELYEFSKWDKFTKERPKTHIFYQGRTYTYDKLPSFPKFESKPKQRLNKKRKVLPNRPMFL